MSCQFNDPHGLTAVVLWVYPSHIPLINRMHTFGLHEDLRFYHIVKYKALTHTMNVRKYSVLMLAPLQRIQLKFKNNCLVWNENVI